MANVPQKLLTVNLQDPWTNKIYKISVTVDEAKRLENDMIFANEKLMEAKNAESLVHATEAFENIEMLDPEMDFNEQTAGDGGEESTDSTFKWPHEAILLLVEEYRLRQNDFKSGKISHKKLWAQISNEISKQGYSATGPQCASKFSGMKKTYKKIKEHNKTSGNSTRTWPYTSLMDHLMGDKPFMTPVATCSSTGKRSRSLSESDDSMSSESSTREKTKTKRAAVDILISTMEKRQKIIEENKERRHKEMAEERERRHRESYEQKNRALQLLSGILKRIDK